MSKGLNCYDYIIMDDPLEPDFKDDRRKTNKYLEGVIKSRMVNPTFISAPMIFIDSKLHEPEEEE